MDDRPAVANSPAIGPPLAAGVEQAAARAEPCAAAADAATGQAVAAVQALAAAGWVVWPGFLPPAAVAGLADEAQAQWQGDAFRQARVGRGAGHQLRPEVRRDHVLWLDPAAPTPWQAHYFAAMEALRLDLNRQIYLGLFDLEAHLAVYPPGAFYRRHLDVFAGTAQRVLSAVVYLNPPDWSAADGGGLRLYLDGGDHHDVAPVGGTLALFLADGFEHEVLPATRRRLSVTGWFRRRPGV